MVKNIKKVAVLGSGIMGSGIACHLANIGLEVLLLDMISKEAATSNDKTVRNGLVNASLKNSIKSKPSPVFTNSVVKNIKTGIADEILAVHVIEHFYYWEVVAILKRWYQILKSGGKLVLECPNLLFACQMLLSDPKKRSSPGKDGQMSMWSLYGDPSWKDPLMCHKWAYTPQSLKAVMGEAGFINLRQEQAQFKLREPRDMRIIGIRP